MFLEKITLLTIHATENQAHRPQVYEMAVSSKEFHNEVQSMKFPLILSATLVLATWSWSQESIRSLATERGRYVGSILNSEWFSNTAVSGYEPIHKAQFNVVVAENEMKFDALQPTQGNFSWTKAEKLITYAQANNMRVRGHALAWHSQVPSWVANGSWTRTTLLAVLKTHITTVVGHFKGRIQEWDVVNEAITDGSPKQWRGTNGDNSSIWGKVIGPDFIDSAFVWAHAADPDAELYYNDYAIEWGITGDAKAAFLLKACSTWVKNGIPIHGVGTQTHIANTHTGTPNNVKNLANALKGLGLNLAITELDIGFASGTTPSAADLQAQGHLYAQFMDVFLNATNMKTFVMWGFTDKYSWLPGSQNKDFGLIYDKNLAKKPAYDSLIAAIKRHDPSSVITPSSSSTGGTSSSSSSNPSSSSSSVVAQGPFASAIAIPGILELEDFDVGGPNVAYSDADVENQGGEYRTEEVDIAGNGGTGYAIAWTANDEWLEYTVNVTSAGIMDFKARYATEVDGGSFHLEVDGTPVTSVISVPNTAGWNTYDTLEGSTTVALTAGQHILRFYIDAASFNLDWLQFSLNGSTPVRSISLNSFMGERQCQIMDLHGKQLAQFTIKAGTSLQESWSQKSNSLPKGVYLARLSAPGIASQMVKLVRE